MCDVLPQTKPANEAPSLTPQNGQVIQKPPGVAQTEIQSGYGVLGNIQSEHYPGRVLLHVSNQIIDLVVWFSLVNNQCVLLKCK